MTDIPTKQSTHPGELKVRAALIARIDEFQARTGLTDRHIGLELFNSHKVLPRIRDPEKSVTLRTIEALEAYMIERSRQAA